MSTTIGILAGLLTTGCWLPQLRRSWRTRSTGDISWTYLAVLTAGVVLWFVYGVMTASVAVIATNVATVVALLTLATFKARFERHPGEAVRPGSGQTLLPTWATPTKPTSFATFAQPLVRHPPGTRPHNDSDEVSMSRPGRA